MRGWRYASPEVIKETAKRLRARIGVYSSLVHWFGFLIGGSRSATRRRSGMLNPVPSEAPRAGSAIRGAGIVIAIAALLTLVSSFFSVNEYVSAFGSEM